MPGASAAESDLLAADSFFASSSFFERSLLSFVAELFGEGFGDAAATTGFFGVGFGEGFADGFGRGLGGVAGVALGFGVGVGVGIGLGDGRCISLRARIGTGGSSSFSG